MQLTELEAVAIVGKIKCHASRSCTDCKREIQQDFLNYSGEDCPTCFIDYDKATWIANELQERFVKMLAVNSGEINVDVDDLMDLFT